MYELGAAFSLSFFFPFVLSLFDMNDSLVTPIDDSDTLFIFQADDGLFEDSMYELGAAFQPDDALSVSSVFPVVFSLFDVDDSLVTPIDDSDTLYLFQLHDGLFGELIYELDAAFRPDDALSLSSFLPVDLSLFHVYDSLVTPIDDSDTLYLFQLNDGLFGELIYELDAACRPDDA